MSNTFLHLYEKFIISLRYNYKLIFCIMKTLKLIAWLLIMLIVNSCTNNYEIDIENEEDIIPVDGGAPNYYVHKLVLGFQDDSGNDLLKELYNAMQCDDNYAGKVKPELYTLEIDFEDGIFNMFKPEPAPLINGVPAYILDIHYPEMSIWKGKYDIIFPELNDDYCYLRFNFPGSRTDHNGVPEGKEKMPFSEKITFTLNCHYLFGNNATHEIVTWWKPNEERALSNETICYRIEFGGREFTEINHSSETSYSMATVVLDR